MPALTCTMDAHSFHILVPDQQGLHLPFQAGGKECFITVANLTQGLQVSDVMLQTTKFTLQALVVFRSFDYNSILLVFTVDRELES